MHGIQFTFRVYSEAVNVGFDPVRKQPLKLPSALSPINKENLGGTDDAYECLREALLIPTASCKVRH